MEQLLYTILNDKQRNLLAEMATIQNTIYILPNGELLSNLKTYLNEIIGNIEPKEWELYINVLQDMRTEQQKEYLPSDIQKYMSFDLLFLLQEWQEQNQDQE